MSLVFFLPISSLAIVADVMHRQFGEKRSRPLQHQLGHSGQACDMDAVGAVGPALDDAVEEFLTVVNFYGQQVEMDNQGRLLLPQALRTKAALDGEVKVMGQTRFLAVHNREALKKALQPGGMSPERKQRVSGYITEIE